jgi:hypothetical protein
VSWRSAGGQSLIPVMPSGVACGPAVGVGAEAAQLTSGEGDSSAFASPHAAPVKAQSVRTGASSLLRGVGYGRSRAGDVAVMRDCINLNVGPFG